jgi:predicted ATPase/DNA-binding SARP family transcriptional activator/Tfp pilus assembly protein PilF
LLTFSILGPLEVRREGVPVALPGRRQRAVLALLLLRANEVVSVDALAEGLWGESPPATPARSLQVFVSDLRKALRPAGLDDRIVTQAPGYRIDVAPGELDVDEVDRLAAEGSFGEALALWRGDPLADFAYEPFAQAAVARLEEQRLALLEGRIAADLEAGRHSELVGELEELVVAHPYREGLRAHLILALYRAGRQSDALAAYQAMRKRLVEELGIDPKPELQELERRILVQDPSLAAPARPPGPQTDLVGREAELAEVEELVGVERLVTLTGPGGIGKTRLAQAVCDRVEGARLVQLAPVDEPALVPATIALSLQVEDGTELVEAIGETELLLCLDNFEQVLDAAPFVAELQARCPGLRVLATSRSPLKLSGEREYPLAPLRPDDAVELFVARARAVSPELAPDEHGEAIRGICERLDRLPLALELAAGRARLLSPQGILDRLEQALPLLTGGPRDRPERQQTLRAAIDWSYRLLDEDEQRLFRSLAVFSGGFELDAAVAVHGRDELDLLDPFSALIEHSLVRREERGGEPRFLLLETIREYAAEQLEAEDEAAGARSRHAAHYLAFAEPGSQWFDSDELTAWLPRAEAERANLRSALVWLLEHGSVDESLLLARNLSSLWIHRGPLAEGADALDRALERPGGDGALRARALGRAGLIASQQGLYDRAKRLLSESQAYWREADAPAELGTDLMRLGVVASGAGDFDEARDAFAEALELGRRVGDKRLQSSALNNLGEIARLAGDLATARARYEESVELDLERGSTYGVALRRLNLGGLALEEGEYERAEQQVLAALEASFAISSDDMTISCLEVLAAVAARRGDTRHAVRLLGAAGAQREHLGFVAPACEARLIDSTAALVEGELAPGELQAARAEGRALSLDEVVQALLSDR